MQLIGLIVMTIGSVGIVVSTGLEIKTREPIYALFMKVMPLIFSVGIIIWGLGIRG